jgi:PAS domain-containing protein
VGSSVAIMDVTQLVETEQAFLKSKEDYQLLNYSMLDGFALHEMIFDSEGKPIDYRFLEVNPAFEALTGLKASDILGRTVLEVLPETEQFWIETYGNVVLSRSSVRFEHYHQTLDKAFEVVAFSPRPNQFAVIFTECRFQDENQLH